MAAPRPAFRSVRVAIGAPAYAYLAVPAVVLSLGAFLLRAQCRDRSLRLAAPVVVVLANALLLLPFAHGDARRRRSMPSRERGAAS